MERLTDKNWKEIEKHCCAKGLYFSNHFTEEQTDKMVKRLAELEDKLESNQLVELPTIISFPDTHPIFGKIRAYQVIWLSELLGIRHEKYTTQEAAEARLKELQEKL